jgi:phage gp16-like protein
MTAARAFKADNGRRALLAKVHLAKKDLRLDDDTYRDILERITGRRSSAECSVGELETLVAHFRAQGFVPKVVGGGKSGTAPVLDRRRAADHPVAKKARAMWISLHQLGVVENPSEQALEAFAKRQLGVERMQWMDQGLGFKLVEALKAMAEREGWSQDLAGVEKKLQIRILKVRLAWAQAKRLGERFSAAAMSDAGLDMAIALYAERIWEARRG